MEDNLLIYCDMDEKLFIMCIWKKGYRLFFFFLISFG